jgi:cytochrome c oxidase subunit 2
MSDKVESLISNGSFWLPGSYSTVSDSVDYLFNGIYWMSLIGTLAIVGIVLYFTVKYLRSPNNQIAKKQVKDNHVLEFAWTIIPFFILMFIFYKGFDGYLNLVVAPENTIEMRATAKKWVWVFENPTNGVKTINELFVPKGVPVKLVMSSEDVLHSFYVPNFRVKKDVLPNKYTNIWFEATKAGVFQIFCTEFCGDGHSDMLATLTVLEPEDYEKWLSKAGSTDDVPLLELGEKLYESKGCNACHSIDGSAKVGPSWFALYAKPRDVASGKSVTADDNYIRESIVNPGKEVVKGYQNVMPSYSGLLTDREINAIIEYIKTLK